MKTRRPWPPPEPDALGFLGSSIGGALLLFGGVGLSSANKYGMGVGWAVVLALAVTALAMCVVYALSRLFGLPRHTWVVGLLALVPGVWVVRSAHARVVRDEAYELLWQVCAGKPVKSAGALEDVKRRAALFHVHGARLEPRAEWVPIDVGSTALVGCTRACGTELRVARTAEVIGCARSFADLALLIEPVER